MTIATVLPGLSYRTQSAEELQAEMTRLAGVMPPRLASAFQSLCQVIEYADPPLIRSHLLSAAAEISDAMAADVREMVDVSRRVRAGFRRAVGELGGAPGAEFDQLGRQISAQLDAVMAALRSTADALARPPWADGPLAPFAGDLADELAALETFETAVVRRWPWSHEPLPATDTALLSASRVEIKQGEGVPIEDLIRRYEAGG